MFFHNYERLCLARGLPVTTAAEQCGFTRGAASHWAGGRVPSAKSLKRIADFFGVSVQFLLTGEDDALPSANENAAEELSKFPEGTVDERERSALFERIRDSRSARILLHTISDMNNDQILEIAEFAMRLKEGGSNDAD